MINREGKGEDLLALIKYIAEEDKLENFCRRLTEVDMLRQQACASVQMT